MYRQLLDTAEQCGIKVVSDDWCCKLLAWLLVCGGSSEMVTYNVKLREDILIAQKRLNVFGGKTPNKELAKKMRKYVTEINNGELSLKNEFLDRYGFF